MFKTFIQLQLILLNICSDNQWTRVESNQQMDPELK